MPETLLDIKNLKIEATVYPPGEDPHDITIVEGVSVGLEGGKVLGLIGESGAGKSTIGLSAMAYGRGGVRITGGEVTLNGRYILKLGPKGLRGLRGREVTYVAQSAAASFNPAKRLMEQVIEATLKHGLCGRSEAEARAVKLFRKLGLPNPETIGNRYPHQVSGGQLQRVMTAMALCPEPSLVIFDEPTTALDVTTQIDVLAAIKEAIRDTGVAALYITHDLAVVAQVSDHILVLRNGNKVEYGPVKQIIEDPHEDYTRALVSVRSIDHEEKKPAEPVLRVDNVTARYKGTNFDVLSNVSVDVAPGQTLAIVGESGSGKSTLLSLICGTILPDRGSITIADTDITTLSGGARDRFRAEQIGVIFQQFNLVPFLDVERNIRLPGHFAGHGSHKPRQELEALLDALQLDRALLHQRADQLSVGQQQRVAVARALANRPALVLADEPTGNLDEATAQLVLAAFLDLVRSSGAAALVATHNIALAQKMDRLVSLSGGRLVADQGAITN